jgi:SOS regulatory protein LexA
MNLNKEQMRIVHSKPCGYSIIRGTKGTGKTTTGVYRILYLKNNYCLYEEDRALMVTYSKKGYNYINDVYDRAKEETKFEYMSLFSLIDNTLDLFDIDSMIERYFLEYKKHKKCNYELILDEQKKKNILSTCIMEIKKIYPRLKIFCEYNIKFFIDEIRWIKCNKYDTLQGYQDAQRVGRNVKKGEGPRRLLKNSSAREAIFKLMLLYNKKLREENYMDYEDMVLFALKQAKSKIIDRYTHILIEQAENFSKLQIDFLKTLYYVKSYSNFVFTVNTDIDKSINSCLMRRGRLYTKVLDERVKRYSLNTNYKINEENIKVSSIENFEYCDFRHNKTYEFFRDFSDIEEEIIVNNEEGNVEYKHEELYDLPVFSNIAAGMPILINPQVEDNFYIPKYWLKGMKDCFILRVKGDSMIGANINDGDHVVIRKQYNAQNRDIVAVNLQGNATLKRLSISKDKVLLMPENDKYEPIPIDDEGIYIIGIVVGLIKNKD